MANDFPPDDPVLQRLDTLIRLQAQIAIAPIREQRDKVVFLNGAGLGPKTIAEMLSTPSNVVTPNAVSSVLKRARKAGGKDAAEAAA